MEPFAFPAQPPDPRAHFDSFEALEREAVFDSFEFHVPPSSPPGAVLPERFNAVEAPEKTEYASLDFQVPFPKLPTRLVSPEQEERPRSVRRFATVLAWVTAAACGGILALAWCAHSSATSGQHRPAFPVAPARP